ncbi:MAG: hypothetical protein HUJ68_01495 [Clostridia bacterium]|nr:hypothetical protein [Clostridia bacterium]
MEPKLTIVYHLHNSYVNTKESILSILSQTDKNFNVVCILDNIDNGIKKLLADKDIMGLANFKKGVSTIILDKTLGHS